MANAFQFVRSPLLSQLAMRWRNTQMIYSSIFPAVTVPKDIFGYIKFDQDVAYRVMDDRMAPGGSANQLDMLGTQVFTQITDKALKAYIDPKETQQISDLRVQQIKTSMLREALGLAAESRAAAILRATATYPAGNFTTLAGVTQWSDPAGDPKNAIMTAKRALLIPSDSEVVFWCGKDVYDGLQLNAKVTAAVQYTGMGAIDTRPILAQYLQVDRIVVGEAFQATNNLGQALTTSRVWGKDAGLAVVNRKAEGGDGMLPTFGVLAQGQASGDGVWRTYVGKNPDRGTQDGVTMVKVEGTYDFIVQAGSLGFVWKNAVA